MSPTGHLAIGLAVKGKTKMPLWALFVGAYWIDLVYFILSMSGIETFGNNPFSHSLMMALLYSLAATLIMTVLMGSHREGILMGGVVFSHWILDFLVWDNLPLWFSKTPQLGLGFYGMIGFDINAIELNSGMIVATVMELIMLWIGIRMMLKNRQLGIKKELQNG